MLAKIPIAIVIDMAISSLVFMCLNPPRFVIRWHEALIYQFNLYSFRKQIFNANTLHERTGEFNHKLSVVREVP